MIFIIPWEVKLFLDFINHIKNSLIYNLKILFTHIVYIYTIYIIYDSVIVFF